MIATSCQTCAAPLPEPEPGVVARCTICGAPQVRLADDLRTAADEARERYEAGLASGAAPTRSARGVDWRQAIVLSAAASVAAVLVCAVLPSLAILAWLLPVPVLLLYRARAGASGLTPLAGARLGALTGVFSSAAGALAGTAYLLVRRFVLHDMAAFDAFYTAALTTAAHQAAANGTAPAPAPAQAAQAALVAAPDFRAGVLLVFALLASLLFITLCVVSGALAAFLQPRRPAAAA